jgi:carbamoyl-phosphate synthase large subunit
MSQSYFFAMLSRMKYINRWGLMNNTRYENISEHSQQVAVLAHCLVLIHNKRFGGDLDPERAALLAIFHDATEIITGELTGRPSPVPALAEQNIPYYGVKEAVFPFNMFQEVDPILGPEMRSTGEVLGLAPSYGEAFFKAEEGAQMKLPLEGTVLISVNRKDKAEAVEVARSLANDGFEIMATENTHKILTEAGIPAVHVNKLHEGRPNIIDHMANGKIQMIVNSPVGKSAATDDSYLRKAAIKAKVPYVTTMAAAKATVEGILFAKENGSTEVKSLQELHSEIREK